MAARDSGRDSNVANYHNCHKLSTRLVFKAAKCCVQEFIETINFVILGKTLLFHSATQVHK